MPPKSARGRKKATIGKVLQNRNEAKMNEIKANKEDKNLDSLPLKLIESSETGEIIACNSDNSNGTNILAYDNQNKTENAKSTINGDIENGINVNDKIAPRKRGRKKADVPVETIQVPTGTDKSDPVINTTESSETNNLGENQSECINDNDKREPMINVQTSDDKNKQDKKTTALKRGRPKKVIKDASDKQLQANENVPSKPGQKKVELNEDIQKEQLQAEEKVPSKRGRRKASPLISDKSSDVQKNVIKEEPSKECPGEKLQTEEKVPSKRGRKKANIPSKSDEFSNLDKIKEGEGKKLNDSKEQQSDVNIPDKELNERPKRGKREANQKSTVQGFDNKEPNQDIKSEEQEASSHVKELQSARNKRKNETPAEEIEKNKQDFNETKILKVVLQRDATIDEMNEGQTKITKKGGAKNTKTGGKRKKEVDTKESGEKSPKMPKSESKSKGQSKKDKMPDVTLNDFSNNSTSPSGKPWNFKIASWNVNGVRAWLEKDGLAYVTHENPDIVTFQETKCSDKLLPKEVNIPGYHTFWLAGDKDGYSGVGLLSKMKPASVNYGIGVKEHDNEGRVITAEYEAFYLVTAYVPNAGRGLVRLDYRMQWDKDFCSYLKKLDEKKPVVLCGDLNVAHEEIDLANPKTNKKNAGFTKEEREGFSALLSEGFIDSFRHLYPDTKNAYTFWTYMMNARAKNVGWRLDYFVLSKKLTEHLCDSVIRKDVFGSDHCPITLFLCL